MYADLYPKCYFKRKTGIREYLRRRVVTVYQVKQSGSEYQRRFLIEGEVFETGDVQQAGKARVKSSCYIHIGQSVGRHLVRIVAMIFLP